jgi:hypothetical protein
MDYIDDATVAKFTKARSEYNVSVAENKINRLFYVDNSKYSFDLVKDARETFLALTDDEKAQVSNALALENKISDLTAAMGVNPDFSLTYEEHFPEQQEPVDPPAPAEDDSDILTVIIIVTVSLIAAATAAVAVVVILKKRSAKKAAPSSEDEKIADEPESIDEDKKVE